MTLVFLKWGSQTNLREEMVDLTTAKLKISVMEADSLGKHWQPLKSIRNENLEYIKNSCKSDKIITTTKHTEQAIHKTKPVGLKSK